MSQWQTMRAVPTRENSWGSSASTLLSEEGQGLMGLQCPHAFLPSFPGPQKSSFLEYPGLGISSVRSACVCLREALPISLAITQCVPWAATPLQGSLWLHFILETSLGNRL